MALIKLDVPLLAQEKSMCCWHTSANMIWAYWQQHTGRQGPMNTIVPVYTSNSGLSVEAFVAKNTHTTNDVSNYLRNHGPVWCAGYWYGFPHVIVLTGIEGGVVYINDPDGGKKKTGNLAWFNSKLANAISGSLMYKDPHRY
jgi:hypothetical protein